MRLIRLISPLFIWLFTSPSCALANPLILPDPKGIYGVGMLNIELSDSARTQLRSEDGRRWIATVFYPRLKTKETASYMSRTL